MPNELTIVDWLGFTEALDKYTENPFGCMGGWVNGQKWDEYIGEFSEDVKPYAEVLRKEVVKLELKCGGDTHQASMTPLFSDGTISSFSFRGWGDFMAAVWNTEENASYGYMDFYMTFLIGRNKNVN